MWLFIIIIISVIIIIIIIVIIIVVIIITIREALHIDFAHEKHCMDVGGGGGDGCDVSLGNIVGKFESSYQTSLVRTNLAE